MKLTYPTVSEEQHQANHGGPPAAGGRGLTAPLGLATRRRPSATATVSVVTLLDPTPEQEALRAVVRDFADAEIAPHAEAWDRDHTFPVDTVRQMGAARAVRPAVPRGVRRRRRRPDHAVHRHRGDRPGRPVAGHHPGGRGRARGQARSTASAPRSSGSAGCPTCAPGRALGRVRADRARRRQRRRRPADQGRARRGDRRVGDRRREGVHHQLRHPDHVAHHRHRPHRDRARPAPSWSPPARPAWWSSPRTARWAGTPPTPTA